MVQDFEELFEFNKEKFVNCPLFYNEERNEKLIEDVKKSKIVIYTAFTGNYDSLKDPEYIDENCDYICFSNNPNIKSDIWKIIPMEDSNLDNNRIAKQYRLFPHIYLSGYDYSLWIDASLKIVGSIREYIYNYLKNPMLNVLHDDRDCIYDEFLISAYISKYSTPILEKQIQKYKEDGFPPHYGLPATGVMFRQHNNPLIIKLMEDWWNEIIKYTNQDQISFSYVCWKNNFHPSVAPIFIWSNEYWSKESGYQHKFHIPSPLTSDNLIRNIETNKVDINNLSSDEIQLLYNDLLTLQYENTHSKEYFEIKLLIYQNNEWYTLTNYYHIKEKNTIRFDLKFFKNIEKMKISPVSRKFVFCTIDSINSDAKELKIVKSNAKNSFSNNKQLFGKIPIYEIEGDFKDTTYFEVTFSLNFISKNEYKLENKIKKLNKIINKKNKEISITDKKINNILNSKSWKITKPMRSFKKIIKK